MFKILVVEDDKDLNRTVCSFLDGSGYEAVGCFGANKAYDAMYGNAFDLIVSDIMMPGIDGYEFAETVRSLNEDILILFMTARDDFASKQKGYRIGIDDYMVKPIDLDELFLRIGALLRRAKIAASHKLEIGKLVLDMHERTAVYEREDIPLTAREFKMIENTRRRRALLALRRYITFFLLIAFVITCCMLLFLYSLRNSMEIVYTEKDIRCAAALTMGKSSTFTVKIRRAADGKMENNT